MRYVSTVQHVRGSMQEPHTGITYIALCQYHTSCARFYAPRMTRDVSTAHHARHAIPVPHTAESTIRSVSTG
eukprot:2511021-Rhodomonas_salina.5